MAVIEAVWLLVDVGDPDWLCDAVAAWDGVTVPVWVAERDNDEERETVRDRVPDLDGVTA